MFATQADLNLSWQGIEVTRLTRHAEVRLQQRGVPVVVLDCLSAYGRREHDHTHCEIIYFDTKPLERSQRYEGARAAKLASDHRGVYALIDSDGCVVTSRHRFCRILRDKSLSSLRPGRTRRPRQLVSLSGATAIEWPSAILDYAEAEQLSA